MTAYSTIADSDIDPESPITTTLMNRLRDNPLAIAEGDATAPALTGMGSTLLASGTVSSAASLDIVMTTYTDYPNKVLILDSFLPAIDTATMRCHVSTDGGSSFDTGASDYRDQTGLLSHIELAPVGVGTTAGESGVGAMITMFNTVRATHQGAFFVQSTYNTGVATIEILTKATHRATAQDTDAFQVICGSGNIASGNWALYGYRA